MIANSPDEATDMVRRLTGPAGPELSCDECFDLLDVYVELELGGADAGAAMPAMRAHLVGCPACRDDHDSLRALLDLAASVRRTWGEGLHSITLLTIGRAED